MSNMYDDFENRFTGKWFSAGWVEVLPKEVEKEITRKDLVTLESELAEINETMDLISQKQLRLANLAKMYNQ